MLFDAHIHLSEIPMGEQARPLPASVLTSVHDPEDPSLSLGDPAVLCSYGLHPLWLDATGRSLETLEKLSNSGQISAVGEFGFDFYNGRDEEKEKKQRDIFRAQCAIAEQYHLPVVLHVRRGMAELFAETMLLKKLPSVIFHCYPGTADEGQAFLKRGVNGFFSFGTPVIKTYPGAIAALKGLPPDRILFETDAPFQPPRGRERTLPVDIRAIYEKGSELLKIPQPELESIVWRTAQGIFPGKL
ncbi:MAG TPA: TatD family hydrolase [bacterium]|nr:TatD family hydrolase [bacterium]